MLRADNARFAVMLKGDIDALEKLLATELTYTHSNAAVQDKAAFISDMKTEKDQIHDDRTDRPEGAGLW